MSSPTAEAGFDAGDDIALRAASYAAWRAHSHRIHIYRRALPALIGVILIGLTGWVAYQTLAWRFAPAANERVSIRMVNPRFHGRTSDNLPYVISARSAARDDRNFQRVVLDQPLFSQNVGTPTQTDVRAANGVYMEDSRVLSLENDVILTDKRGYNFKTDRSVIDTRAGIVSGQKPIDGVGPLGRIAASSYAVENGGERVVFRGKVRARIETNR